MTDVFGLIALVVLITVSGALAPGPLFVATIAHGSRHGVKSGLIFSLAHTAVEFSLVMVLALGLLTVSQEPMVKVIVGSIGGIFLILFGVMLFRDAFRLQSDAPLAPKSSFYRLFFTGLAFTGLNPFFIVWWLTIGAELILIALAFASLAGVILMYICHVWMDWVWLSAVAYFSKKGTDILSQKWYQLLIFSFGFVLIFFGIIFLNDAFTTFINL